MPGQFVIVYVYHRGARAPNAAGFGGGESLAEDESKNRRPSGAESVADADFLELL
jgi:hypothetical protein